MPSATFFTQLGLFVMRDFLDARACAALCDEMQTAAGAPSLIRVGREAVVNEEVRRVTTVTASSESKSLLKARLREVLPELEGHFRVTLSDFDKPQFLVYREGGFYTPHRDSTDNAEAPKSHRDRKVSVVIFLNDETNKPQLESYGGGQLTFYGLLQDTLWQNCGLPLTGEAGLLVAFSSNIMHEVKPVVHGTRYTIVTWFL